MSLGDRQGTIPWRSRCSRLGHNATCTRYANEPDNNAEVLGRSDKACLLQYCTCMHSKQCLLKRGEVAELLQEVVSLSPCTQGSHCPNEYAHVLSACIAHVLRNCIEGTSTAPMISSKQMLHSLPPWLLPRLLAGGERERNRWPPPIILTAS